jgi:hypothetical protein
MKRTILSSVFLLMGIMWATGISPYLKVNSHTGPMNEAVGQVKTILEEGAFTILGQYQPAGNPDLYVLVFTSDELIELCRQVPDRGMLAAAMKVGFQKVDGKISVSMVNPEYLFYAYFQEEMKKEAFKSSALKLNSKMKNTLIKDSPANPFGGDVSADKLMKYKYMAGMPGFDKAVSLMEVEDFEQGLATIRDGISRSSSTHKVYELVDRASNTAVFGLGLPDKEKGEAHFLPIIGENHVAAMPYELILQGKEVSMLHGRFRFASHWPELKMKTFTKIMSSPGDVEDAMKSLFETD